MVQPLPMPRRLILTLRELLEAQHALQKLSNEKLPVKLAYNIARMLKEIQPELDEFYKQRAALVEKHGQRRKSTDAEKAQHGPEVVEVLSENLPAFRRDVDELVNVKVTIDREPLSMEGLPDMTPADLLVLEPLFEVD